MKNNKKQTEAKSSNAMLLLGIAAVILVAGIVWYTNQPAAETVPASAVVEEEGQFATLSPAQFTGTVRQAYQVAREIPEVLDQLPCYCGCMREAGHQSNLDCFKDDHSTYCSMCQNIALDAGAMHKRGMSTDDIRTAIVDKYAHMVE